MGCTIKWTTWVFICINNEDKFLLVGNYTWLGASNFGVDQLSPRPILQWYNHTVDQKYLGGSAYFKIERHVIHQIKLTKSNANIHLLISIPLVQLLNICTWQTLVTITLLHRRLGSLKDIIILKSWIVQNVLLVKQ